MAGSPRSEWSLTFHPQLLSLCAHIHPGHTTAFLNSLLFPEQMLSACPAMSSHPPQPEWEAYLLPDVPLIRLILSSIHLGFPAGSDGQESTCSAGDLGSIPELGRPLGEENGYPLQYSCLENLMDRGPWPATIHLVTESDRTEQLTLTLPSLQYTLSPEKYGKVPPKSYAKASLRKFEMRETPSSAFYWPKTDHKVKLYSRISKSNKRVSKYSYLLKNK